MARMTSGKLPLHVRDAMVRAGHIRDDATPVPCPSPPDGPAHDRDHDRMNKTELEYAARLHRDPGVLGYRFEAMNLRLGHKCWYKPDFWVSTTKGWEYHEVKGGWVQEDAIVKLKVAAREYHPIPFVLARKKGRTWIITRIGV